jgi:hypothetical protein
MIHTTENFFNKIADEIRKTYFAEIKTWEDSKSKDKATYAIELFNNGCLTYRMLIGRLAKACGESNATIHGIVSKYIVSFGEYEYKPSKKYNETLRKASTATN